MPHIYIIPLGYIFVYLFDRCFPPYSEIFHLYRETVQLLVKTHDHPQLADMILTSTANDICILFIIMRCSLHTWNRINILFYIVQ